MRTYNAKDWQAANEAWADYDMEVWGWLRELGKHQGMLYPPLGEGGKEGSQRELLLQALTEDPDLLRFAVGHSKVHSWGEAIGMYLEERYGARQAAKVAEEQYLADKRSHGTQREATKRLADILVVLADSAGTTPPLQARAQQWHTTRHDEPADFTACPSVACTAMAWLLSEAPMDSQ